MKKFVLISSLLIIAVAVVFFIYRYQILQYSAENIIRSILPKYVKIDKIIFDAKTGEVSLNGFKILNPRGFSSDYLLEIESISCRYKMRGQDIREGFEVTEPLFKRPVLNIERLLNGRTNLEEMAGQIENAPPPAEPAKAPSAKSPTLVSRMIGGRKPSDIVTLPETFLARDGKILFLDRLVAKRPHIITFENVEAKLSLKLDDYYTRVLDLSTTGEGNLNGDRNEVVNWTTHLDPTKPKLTMSNRFEVSNLDILTFEPYYDKQSPFVFKKGRFSGTLIFDFDNGNIGSTNEIHLRDIAFYIKPGYEGAQFWETTVNDLAKYFTTPFGEVVFDFKIKGDMNNPKFYLGPISKEAIASMAIDKISNVIKEVRGEGTTQTEGAKSDIEKAKQYIDLFKGLIKKE